MEEASFLCREEDGVIVIRPLEGEAEGSSLFVRPGQASGFGGCTYAELSAAQGGILEVDFKAGTARIKRPLLAGPQAG